MGLEIKSNARESSQHTHTHNHTQATNSMQIRDSLAQVDTLNTVVVLLFSPLFRIPSTETTASVVLL